MHAHLAGQGSESGVRGASEGWQCETGAGCWHTLPQDLGLIMPGRVAFYVTPSLFHFAEGRISKGRVAKFSCKCL